LVALVALVQVAVQLETQMEGRADSVVAVALLRMLAALAVMAVEVLVVLVVAEVLVVLAQLFSTGLRATK
jgi:hypothetical protein